MNQDTIQLSAKARAGLTFIVAPLPAASWFTPTPGTGATPRSGQGVLPSP